MQPLDQPARALSGREREVLTLVAMGETSHGIADRLHISVTTVDTHIRHCLTKLSARNRPNAILIALQRGELDGQCAPPAGAKSVRP